MPKYPKKKKKKKKLLFSAMRLPKYKKWVPTISAIPMLKLLFSLLPSHIISLLPFFTISTIPLPKFTFLLKQLNNFEQFIYHK